MKTTDQPENIKEMLSALADGEECSQCSESDLIDLVCKDSEARFAWQSMHLTRDVMQADYYGALNGNTSSAVSEDFASRMRALVDKEESFAAGNNVVALSSRTAGELGRTAARSTKRPVIRASNDSVQTMPFSLWKPVVGLGLAASLAGASFLFSQLWQANQSPNQTLNNQPQLASNAPSVNESERQFVAFEPAQVDSAGTRWRMDTELARNVQIEQRLNTLLTNHLEDASMGAVHGMLSHSRVVSYDSLPGTEESQ